MNPNFDIGKFFKERIGNYSETPPDGLWEKIATSIPSTSSQGRSGSGSNIRYYYFAAGLFVAGLSALFIYLFSPAPQIAPPGTDYTLAYTPSVNHSSPITEELPAEAKSTQVAPKGKTGNPTEITLSTGSHSSPAMATNSQQALTISNDLTSEQNGITATPVVQSATVNTPAKQNPSNLNNNPVSTHPEKDTPVDTNEEEEETIESSYIVEQVITACRGEELTLYAGEGTGHRWSTGQSGQTISIPAIDDIRLTVDYIDLQGRKVTGIFNISLLNCSVFVPRAFSPNDDGHNDFYRVKAEGISNFEMKIFSKWGEMVFQSRDPEAGWDGKQKGISAPAGIYIYQINYTDPNNQTRAIFGTLTLLR